MVRNAVLGLIICVSLTNAFLIRAPISTIRPSSLGMSSSSLGEEQSPATMKQATTPPPPVLNGQRVLPTKVLLAGLQGHTIAAVYAVLDSSYKRGGDGWEAVQHIGITRDLAETIQTHAQEHESSSSSSSRVSHVRALSFSYPQPTAMQTVASQWREKAIAAGANLDQDPKVVWTRNVLEYVSEDNNDEDDDEEEEEEWPLEMSAQAMAAMNNNNSNELSSKEEPTAVIVSPFAEPAAASSAEEESSSSSSSSSSLPSSSSSSSMGRLPLTLENIDKVLEEVRPYLISDGGNVAVSRIDLETKTVYLELQGACGSCPSSTVTMQMGIERVLKEHFDVNQILQVDQGPTELTWEAVEREVNRIRPAIIAMGGVCELVSVESATGVVKMRFRGFNKVQQGLELALRDLPFVNAVHFTGDD